MDECNDYFRSLSRMDADERPEFIDYYSDDELEDLWVHSRDNEFGELMFDGE